MWQRFLRALTAMLNMYSFYTNPVRFIFSLLAVILIPYLAYIFWGSLILIALTGAGCYLLYRAFKKSRENRVYS